MTQGWGDQQMATPWGKASGPRAGFWRRFGAYVIDSILVNVVNAVIQALIHGAIAFALAVLVWLTYYTFMEGGPRGAGFGKQAMGIRVIDMHTGGPIGYNRAFIRTIGHIVSGVVIFLGYFWMLWDDENQCWHDKFAGDVVVPTADYPPQTDAWM